MTSRPRIVFDDSVRPELHAELARRLESSTATSAYQLALDGPLACHAMPMQAACEACGTAWTIWHVAAAPPPSPRAWASRVAAAAQRLDHAGGCPRCEPERCVDEWSDEHARKVLAHLAERFRDELAVLADAKILEGAKVRHPRDVELLAKLAELAARDYITACEACGVYTTPAGDLVLGGLSPEEHAWLVRGRG